MSWSLTRPSERTGRSRSVPSEDIRLYGKDSPLAYREDHAHRPYLGSHVTHKKLAIAALVFSVTMAAAPTTHVGALTIRQYEGNTASCTKAIKSGKVVTTKTFNTCWNGVVRSPAPCWNFQAGKPTGQKGQLVVVGRKTYLLHVGSKPLLLPRGYTAEDENKGCSTPKASSASPAPPAVTTTTPAAVTTTTPVTSDCGSVANQYVDASSLTPQIATLIANTCDSEQLTTLVVRSLPANLASNQQAVNYALNQLTSAICPANPHTKLCP